MIVINDALGTLILQKNLKMTLLAGRGGGMVDALMSKTEIKHVPFSRERVYNKIIINLIWLKAGKLIIENKT